MAFDDDDDRLTGERVARRARPLEDDDESYEKKPLQQSSGELTADEKQWGMFCHLSALAGLLVGGFLIIGPLICWLVKKDTSKFVDFNGKESVNFQISMMIYGFVCAITIIGIPIAFLVGIYAVIMPIIAGMKAQNGEWYEYQMILRIIK
jgi:uncharacterized Tic20 family protein